MPPRLTQRPCSQLLDSLPWRSGQIHPSASRSNLLRAPRSAFTTSSKSQASQREQREYGDPYALAQARQRKAANLARQAVLKKEREASIGDPVRGVATPFIQSFDTLIDPPSSTTPPTSVSAEGAAEEEASHSPHAQPDTPLNFFLSQSEFDAAIEDIRDFTEPIPMTDRYAADPQKERDETDEHQRLHANAQMALSRIVSLENGSSQDRTRVNIQRCIEKFGRHRTDEQLPPRPAIPPHPSIPPTVEKSPRSGPDTGSPEVQVAILTSKIRVLANHLEGSGKQDKVNKRNLRLLVHRRQKLLKYLRRKERGGPRWQNLIETLGLTDGTWKGEISM